MALVSALPLAGCAATERRANPSTTPWLCDCKGPSTKGMPSMDLPSEQNGDVVFWARWRMDRTDHEYLPIADAQEEEARRASGPWMGIFRADASPYAPRRPARRCFRIQDGVWEDILRYQYEVGALKLTVWENAGQILVRVDGGLHDPTTFAEDVQNVARLLFRDGDKPLHFAPWSAKDEVARFSSEQAALGMSPPGTIDGAITKAGALYFVFIKWNEPSATGMAPLPTRRWLEGPLRAAWEARQVKP